MPGADSIAGEKAETAIPRLLEEHGGEILGLGLRLCPTRQEAEDLVQETFLQAFRKWEQFEGRSAASSWLFTIASRVCQRQQRRRAGEPRNIASLNELLPQGDEGMAFLEAVDEDPLSSQLRRELRERMEEAIAALPLRFRLPLVLKDIMELSVAEIAAVLGIKEATVKTRVHRARLALHKVLVEELPKQALSPGDHGRTMCLDLLKAKQEALDRGVEFPVSPRELCGRCESLFSTLELTVDVCHQLRSDVLPAALRRNLLEKLD